MGKIAVHEFVSLDGVFENPSWTFEFGFDPAMGDTLRGITDAATAILLGRETFDMFAAAWSGMTAEDDEGAPFFNDTPKFVVGSTESSATWGPSTNLGRYETERIRQLKTETEGTIYVSGSGTLVRALLADGLIDELHLFVYPIALGSGRRLWANGADGPSKLTLNAHDVYANGVVHLQYGPARHPDRQA